MKKLLLSLVGILCSMSMWAETYEWSHDGQNKTLTVTAAKGASAASTYSGYSISYGGKTYTSCIKMESSTTLTFTTTKASTITVGVALKDGNAYDNAGKTALSLTTGSNDAVIANTGISSKTTGAKSEAGLTVTFSSVPAGTQVIKRAGSEEGVFYIKVEEEDASKVNKPTISSSWGASYGDPSTVTITCSTNGASIYYTTNGDTPTSSSTLYSASFNVNTNCTVKAIAIKDGMTNSSVASQDVTINNQRNINFDFSAVTLTQGSAIANTTSANNATYKLPSGRMYYIDGKTQTGWNDGTKDYALGAAVTIDKDYTFTPVFADNNVELGDVAATVNWTFATAQGAPSAGIEGNVGYYAAQTTVGGKKLDVVMTIDARQDVAFQETRGKWNTTSADNRAQVNKGTVFTIPAIAGMVVTYTATNGTPKTTSVTFDSNAGEVSGSSIVYTYNGAAETIDIIDCGDNLYPSGISVTYPGQFDPSTTFSMKTAATNNVEVAAGADHIAIPSAANLTINGGSVTVSNGQKDPKNLVTTAGFAMTNGNTFFTVTLTNALQAGDVITATMSAASRGLKFATSDSYSDSYPGEAAATTAFSYTVTEGDGICGETTFNIFRATGNSTYFNNFKITRPATVATANINAYGYGTFSCGYDVQITGAKAYTAAIKGDELVCTEITNGLVPAGEGVLLFKEGTTEATTATALFAASAPAVENNVIKATTLADGSLKDIAEVTSSYEKVLVLSGDTFLPYEGAAFVANKAYIPYNAPAGAKSLRIVFGGQTTGIKTVSAQKAANAKFIENGRIVIVKDGAKYNVAGQVIK